MAAFIAANLNPTNYVGGVQFRPEQDISDLSGKVVLVTGGNSGLGKETIRQLIQHNPKQVFLAARSEEKAKDAISELSMTAKETRISWLPLDLSSTKSVQAAAEQLKSQSSRLDILILNAGVMSSAPEETDLGHDIQLGTNHTGHFMLTRLLLPILSKTAEEPNSDVRIVVVSSVGHNLAPSFATILDQEKLKKCHPNTRYGASKAANILFAAELARRHPSIMAVSVHPANISTDLYGDLARQSVIGALGARMVEIFGTPVSQGAWNQVWAAAGAKRQDLVNGGYYVPVGILKPRNRYLKSREMGKELWDWTETELRRAGISL